ncbi:MAG: response regulator [Candidatus Omnitrophica bacterium]|nr:response regulator [Candidatus Omnitrophota bacterium]
MAEIHKTKIAVIVEDQRLQDYIVLLLVGEGYEVKAFSSQIGALNSLEADIVDLVISEFHSPNINGLDICKILRKNFIYNLIPIFFIIEDTEPLNAARLIFAGADDYIKKSQIEDELFLKVKLILYRMIRLEDVNTVTKLPGRSGLVRELQKRKEIKDPFAIYDAQIFRFRDFLHHYGFEKADAVIKFTGALILKTLRDMGNASDYLCHYQPEEFLFLSLPDNTDAIANRIIKEFDQGISAFYDDDEKRRGHALIKNRNGEIQQVPFLKLHIGIAINSYFQLFDNTRIVQIANEIKELAQKTPDKSMYLKEERKNYSLS